jgi:Protein of unknown function (DUF2802)
MLSFNLMSLVAIGGASSSACALLVIFVLTRTLRRLKRQHLALESSVAAMRRELEIVGSISLRTGRRVKRIEHDYSGVADRVELVELRGSAPSFDQAIDSARRGIDSGRLTQQYGLSRVEAELLTRLHGRRRTA